MELGWPSGATLHYEHIAGALGLGHTLVPLAADSKGRGPGAAAVRVQGGAAAVGAAVAAALSVTKEEL